MVGIIRCDTIPKNLEVSINNNIVGNTPIDIKDVKPNIYSYTIKNDKYIDSGTLIVQDNKIIHISIDFISNEKTKEYIDIDKEILSAQTYCPDPNVDTTIPSEKEPSTSIPTPSSDLTTSKLDNIIGLLKLLVKAQETELVDLRYNSGLQTLTLAVTTTPDVDNITPSQGGYYQIKVAEIIGRTSPELYFLNEGPGTIYVNVLTSKKLSLQQEDEVREGEFRTYYDVYELRVRTTTANTKYRASEYEALTHRVWTYKTGLPYVSETNVAVAGIPNTENIVTDATKGLGRPAVSGYIINDGPGNLKMEMSVDGTNFSPVITMITNQIINFEDEIYTLKLDATINGTAYRLNVK